MEEPRTKEYFDSILRNRKELKESKEKNEFEHKLDPFFVPREQYEILLLELTEKEDLKVPTLDFDENGPIFFTLKDFIEYVYNNGYYCGRRELRSDIKSILGL